MYNKIIRANSKRKRKSEKNMKTYTVYINDNHKNPQEEAVFVPEGFSFLMFLPLINLIVAAYRRCWLLCAIMIGIEVLTYFAGESEALSQKIIILGLPFQGYILLRLAMLFFFGLWVNDFWRKKLEKRGYRLAEIVTVPSGFSAEDLAEQKFYQKFYGEAK